jgi:glycosyltransferase involved in cell wall biosynthesis
MKTPQVLFVEGTDFDTFPAGGQLAMARSLIKVFGERWALVGLGDRNASIGQWQRKNINGRQYWFFPVGRREMKAEKPLVPARLSFYLGLRRFKNEILSLGCPHVFTQAPDGLLAISRWGLGSIVFMFPGVENPLKISRYTVARRIWPVFDWALFSAVKRVNLILACADEEAIGKLVQRSHGRISRESIVQLPTCVDTEEFFPMDASRVRRDLGISQETTIFAASGRIGRFKGWELLLDAFKTLQLRRPGSRLFFIGDGEDRPRLESAVAARGLCSTVHITGFQPHTQIAHYLNAANVVVSGSYAEGWSVAMLEALACGKPLVSTKVSGANQMILPGKNGFIVHSRNPIEFSDAMEKALELPDVEPISTGIARKYSMTWLGERLGTLWPPLCREDADSGPKSQTPPGLVASSY